MTIKYSSIKGMSDILPADIDLWHRLEDMALSVFGAYGYEEIRTPIVEKTELFVRGIGSNTAVVEKEMYTFKDISDDMLSLRPEGTASVVRAFIESGAYPADNQAKYLYIGPMFRRERPQKGRYRQFHQIGVEALGISDPLIDAEQIAMGEVFFKRLRLSDFKIEINSLGCDKCRPAYNNLFAEFLKKKKLNLCGDCHRRIEKNPLRAFDCKNPGCIDAMNGAPLIGDHICNDCKDHFSGLKKFLNLLGTKFVVNHKIVRGLDYYMRTAFEFTTDKLGAQGAIAAGGRYDGLVHELGGPKVPGIGFAIGMERVILLMKEMGVAEKGQKELIFFALLGKGAREKVMPIVNLLRRDGIKAELDYEDHSLKSQMRRADKLEAHTVIIVGEEETKKGTAVIRNMHTKEQSEVKLADLARRFVHVES